MGRGGELLNHSIGDGATVARKALEAGVDMDMEGNLYGTTLAAQVRSGKIPESVVDEAVRRMLRVKFALGLFDHPYTQPGPAYEATPERRALARKVADETMVLLKNDPVEGIGTLLPLTAKAKKVALIGPLADDQRSCWAPGPVTGNPKDVITLQAELCSSGWATGSSMREGCGLLSGEDANVLKHVTFGGRRPCRGACCRSRRRKTIAEAVETAKKADVAILALGEPTNWMEGEASSRAHLGFTGAQEKLLEAVVGNRQAGDSGGAGGAAAGAEVGRGACAGDSGGVEPGHRGGACGGRCALWRREPVRQAAGESAPRRGPGAALLCAACPRAGRRTAT